MNVCDKIQKLDSLDHFIVYGLVFHRRLDLEPAGLALGPYDIGTVGRFAVGEACHVAYLDVGGVVWFLEDCKRVNRLCSAGWLYIRYLSWLRSGISSRPWTLRGVSAYAASRLAGFPLLSYAMRASSKTNISQSSELVLEASSGCRISDSGTGMVATTRGALHAAEGSAGGASAFSPRTRASRAGDLVRVSARHVWSRVAANLPASYRTFEIHQKHCNEAKKLGLDGAR